MKEVTKQSKDMVSEINNDKNSKVINNINNINLILWKELILKYDITNYIKYNAGVVTVTSVHLKNGMSIFENESLPKEEIKTKRKSLSQTLLYQPNFGNEEETLYTKENKNESIDVHLPNKMNGKSANKKRVVIMEEENLISEATDVNHNKDENLEILDDTINTIPEQELLKHARRSPSKSFLFGKTK